jgi:hypothetical protein
MHSATCRCTSRREARSIGKSGSATTHPTSSRRRGRAGDTGRDGLKLVAGCGSRGILHGTVGGARSQCARVSRGDATRERSRLPRPVHLLQGQEFQDGLHHRRFRHSAGPSVVQRLWIEDLSCFRRTRFVPFTPATSAPRPTLHRGGMPFAPTHTNVGRPYYQPLPPRLHAPPLPQS